MTAWLTLHYVASAFVLLAAASAMFYYGLERSMNQADWGYLRQKIQVLTSILKERPLDRPGLDQEVLEEAEISGRFPSPFFLRVLDQNDHLIVQTPRMGSMLPVASFPLAPRPGAPARIRRSIDGRTFLLGSATVPAARSSQSGWQIQAALDASSEQSLLASYRREIALVLVAGLLAASALGAWIARRGLRPIADITRATELIGAQRLSERIGTGPWPRELAALACAFDGMLERLQDAFERLSQFSADLAHELRTPINNLLGEAQVMLSRARTADEYAPVVQSALEEYARLARMIDSMLFLARAEQGQSSLALRSLEASGELQAVVEFYQALADEQGITLSWEGHARVLADEQLLRRALSNLVSNALKHTGRGGRIALQASQADGGAVSLSVLDSGIGIANEHLAKLGDRFYRIDPSRSDSSGGAGLGLAIVKSIMALHGGSLLIESEPGRGTRATLRFGAPRTALAVAPEVADASVCSASAA